VSDGKVVLDADQYLKLLDSLQKTLDELRSIGAKGFTSRGVPADIEISAINWMRKEKQPAAPGDKWAWAFAYDRDGNPVNAKLIDALKRYEKVRVGDYEISLGGRDGRLLNRRLAK